VSVKEIQTSIAKISLEKDSIILVEFIEKAYETLEENALAINKLGGSVGSNLVVFDIKKVNGVSKEARKLAKSKRDMYVFEAVGIVVGNILTRMLASFFIGISEPGYPVKIFDCKKEAKMWLLDNHSDLKQSDSPKIDI